MSEVIRLQEVRVVSGVGFHFLPLFLMISQRSILQTTAATTAAAASSSSSTST